MTLTLVTYTDTVIPAVSSKCPCIIFGPASVLSFMRVSPPVRLEIYESEFSTDKKIVLLRQAAATNPSDWFGWVNPSLIPATVSLHRLDRLSPQLFHFTTSDEPRFDPKRIGSPSYHCIAGDAYLLHSSSIHYFAYLYESYIRPDRPADSDQVLWTRILSDRPDLFQAHGHGYGQILKLLTPSLTTQ